MQIACNTFQSNHIPYRYFVHYANSLLFSCTLWKQEFSILLLRRHKQFWMLAKIIVYHRCQWIHKLYFFLYPHDVYYSFLKVYATQANVTIILQNCVLCAASGKEETLLVNRNYFLLVIHSSKNADKIDQLFQLLVVNLCRTGNVNGKI